MMSNSFKIPSAFEQYAIPPSTDFQRKGARQIRTTHFYFQELRRHQGISVRLLNGNIIYSHDSWEYPQHRHSHYELILPQEGIYRCQLNGQELVLHPGSCLLIQPGDIHQDHLLGSLEYFGFEFSIHRLDTGLPFPYFLRRGTAAQEHVFSLQYPEEIHALLGLFQGELQRHPGGFFPVVDGIFQTLFWLIFMQEGQKPQFEEGRGLQVEEELQKQRILECFQQNHERHMEMEKLCQLLGMSASTLTRTCRRYFGMSPMRAFMQQKMEIIKAYLADHPRILLKDLAARMGFADQFHFSKCFRQIVGVSPRQYLEQVSRQRAEY